MIYNLIIAGVILVGGIYRAISVKDDIKDLSATLTLTASLCISVLTFPYFMINNKDFIITVLKTIRYGLTSITMNVDGDILGTLKLNEPIATVYTYFLYAMYILGPMAASVFIGSFSKTLIDYLEMMGYKKVHVFNKLDENTLTICESLSNIKTRQLVIFCNCNGEDKKLERKARSCNALIFNKDMDIIRIKRNKKYEFYITDEDQEQVMKLTSNICDYLARNKRVTKDKVIIRPFIKTDTLEMVRNLDKKYGDKLNIRYINKENAMVTELLLKEKEDFVSSAHKEIMILGETTVSKELIRTLLTVLNNKDTTYRITLFDPEAKQMADKFKAESPEIMNLPLKEYLKPLNEKGMNYNLHFVEAEIEKSDLEDKLEELRNPTHLFICSGNDKVNFDLAERLKRYYGSRSSKMEYPKIFCLIKDSDVAKNINDETIVFFGDDKETYNYEKMIHPYIENTAEMLHLHYLGDNYDKKKSKEKNLADTGYYKYDNQHSSINSATGLQFYKAYIESQNKEKINNGQYIETYLSDENNLNKLAECEHQRWNTYERLIGYRKMTDEQLDLMAKSKKSKNLTNKDLLLHPALVEYEDLPLREAYVDVLYEKYGYDKKSKYIQLDKDILSMLKEI